MDFKNRVRNKMIIADDNSQKSLRVMGDEQSFKTAQKMYKSYISEQDFSKFHAFMLELDRLVTKFGGHPLPPPDQQQQGDNRQQQQKGGKQQPQQQPQQQAPAPRSRNAPAPVEDDQDE